MLAGRAAPDHANLYAICHGRRSKNGLIAIRFEGVRADSE